MADLLTRLQQRISERSLLKHPFYQAWQAGRLTLEDLAVYSQQYYFFEAAFPRFLSAIHSRCPDRTVRHGILENLWDEEHGAENHRELWLDFCVAVGLDRDAVEHGQVQPSTRALLRVYEKLCFHRPFQEGLAALYAYEAQVPQIAMEKMRGLKDHNGVTEAGALKFFAVHGVLDVEHSRKEEEAIVAHTTAEQEQAVEDTLQAALDAWWAFLDSVEEQRRLATSGAAC